MQPIWYVRGSASVNPIQLHPTNLVDLRRLFEAQAEAYQSLQDLMVLEKEKTERLVSLNIALEAHADATDAGYRAAHRIHEGRGVLRENARGLSVGPPCSAKGGM